MKLFYKAGACSLSPHIILHDMGLDFSVEKVDLASKKTEHGEDYLAINPKGSVPALLLEDGTLLTEGVAIVQYLADEVPHRNLIPAAGTMARYHAIEWLNYISTELHKEFGALFKANVPAEYQEIARQRLHKQFSYVNDVLSKQDYVLGNHFSVADAYLFTVLRWAKATNIDLSSYPAIIAYQARIAEHPAVKAALNAEGLTA